METTFSKELKRLLPKMQYQCMAENPEGFRNEIEKMNKISESIPQLGGTDGLRGHHPLSLHYFCGGNDWYITEWDREDTLYGYVILNGDYDMSEWGYISLSEILSLEIEEKCLYINLDLHCPHKTVEEALFKTDMDYFKQYDPKRIEEVISGE